MCDPIMNLQGLCLFPIESYRLIQCKHKGNVNVRWKCPYKAVVWSMKFHGLILMANEKTTL